MGRFGSFEDVAGLDRVVGPRLGLKVATKHLLILAEKIRTTLARAFTVVGIYDGSLDEFDTKFILGDIRNIQKINNGKIDEVSKFGSLYRRLQSLIQVGKDVF
jgi:lipoprotein-releasing system permease protein